MSLKPEDRQFLKYVFQRIKDEPLHPGSELYQPVYEAPGCEDPVQLLESTIEFSDSESLQFFSGFRGSGKTTELLRLKERLEKAGYFVLYGDALDYINPAEEIDISDLLIVLAGAFNDALNKELKADLGGESYWTRLKNYLINTEVEVSEVGASAEAETPGGEIIGGLKTGLDLKLALKTAPSFRQKLQHYLANRIGELKKDVDKFFEDGVKAIRKERGDDVRVVFLFDQMEQIRGSLSTEQKVLHSVERVFSQHIPKLAMPYIHAVYTVPPWLQFILPGGERIQILPSVRQWNNDSPRSEFTPGWNGLYELIKKRFGPDGLTRFFGPSKDHRHPLADRLLAVCGGHFRDLLILLRETAVRARSLPVTEQEITLAIAAVRGNFLPIALDDARWLQQIGQFRACALKTTNPEDVSRLTRFLDTHFVLYLKNGKEWYDIHPLVRDEVDSLLKQQAKAVSTP